MIYTSYFAKFKLIINPVSICGKCAPFYKGPEYKKLAPKYGFFMDYKNGKIDSIEYTRCFQEQVLSHLDPKQVVSELFSFYQNETEITLLCYEKPIDFCHRHLVAQWLSNAGIECKEKEF